MHWHVRFSWTLLLTLRITCRPHGRRHALGHDPLAPLNAQDLASYFSTDHAVYTDYLTLEPQP